MTLLKKKFLDPSAEWEEVGDPEGRYVIAADVATSGAVSADFSAFLVLRINKTDGTKTVVHIKRVKGMDVSKQIDTLEMMANDFNRCLVLVEKNNVGVALIQELIKRNVNVEEFVTDRPKKEGAIRYLQNEISRGRIHCPVEFETYPELRALYEELVAFGIRIKRGKETMEALSGHDDTVDALWLANLAAQGENTAPAHIILQD